MECENQVYSRMSVGFGGEICAGETGKGASVFRWHLKLVMLVGQGLCKIRK